MRLLHYVAGRLLLLLPVLFGTSVLIFLLLRLIPGDPAQVILGLRATPERLAIVRGELGLDLPLHLQYGQWLGKALRGDLGKDFRSNEAVTALLSVRLPVTIQLTLMSLALAILIAMPLGIRAATKPGGIAILLESALSFIGLGTQPPDPSLGLMLSEGRSFMQQAPWMVMAPGLAISIAVLGFNLLGNGLQDLLNPARKGR